MAPELRSNKFPPFFLAHHISVHPFILLIMSFTILLENGDLDMCHITDSL